MGNWAYGKPRLRTRNPSVSTHDLKNCVTVVMVPYT
jgi:hypothetical protein